MDEYDDQDDLPVCLTCRHFEGCDCEHECVYVLSTAENPQNEH